MARKPKPYNQPSAVRRTWMMVRRNPVKSITAVLGVLAAYPSGMAGAKLIGEQAEPAWYANRGWVRELVDDKIKPWVTAQNDDRKILRDIQIDGANRSKRDEVNNLAKWIVEREKAKDALTLDLIDRQMKVSKDSIEALDQQLKTLELLKAQGK